MKKQRLVKTGSSGKIDRYTLAPAVNRAYTAGFAADSASIFGEEETAAPVIYKQVTAAGRRYEYVPYGPDDDTPAKVRRLIMKNMVTTQGLAFDIQACYGQGVRFVNRDAERKDTDSPEIREFCLRNSIHELFMEQATDMKYYFFNVTEIVLNRDPTPETRRIMRMHHLESCYVRFEKSVDGKIPAVFYGAFANGIAPSEAVRIPLLDATDPLGDLEVRCGRKPSPDTGKKLPPTAETRFAIVARMPTPGNRMYPTPYYWSIFQDDWYDIYQLIGKGKKQMIKNTSAPRWLIEIHQDYFNNLCNNEGIIDPEKRRERILKEQQNIVDFVCGVDNVGKSLISSYYVDADGHQQAMVRITNLASGTRKEGGDWTEDMSEAANSLCFALGVHPNLIGATPGKSQMNNSGSDKRELFTLKQAMERPFHDIMLKPYHVVLHFNQWADRYTVDVPMIELTTLDKNTSAEEVRNRE